jgi:radical SAM protein with 4Fe4S-binding SPASM domain
MGRKILRIISTFANAVKRKIGYVLRLTGLGNKTYFMLVNIVRKPKVDFEFPNLISIEIASTCDLSCRHCPSHSKEVLGEKRKFGFINMDLFDKAMDEIDLHGKRKIYLHKDGEPLLHPKIAEILRRLKLHHEHEIYLTTNAYRLTDSIIKLILEARVDTVNFSIGAVTPEMYRHIRGGDLPQVVANVHDFLETRNNSPWKPHVIVQIIDLQTVKMNDEIKRFRKYWSEYDVEIQIWDELTWGLKADTRKHSYRYPCFSLWDSFNINSDGIVTACCMDWNQTLQLGDFKALNISQIWNADRVKSYRRAHMNNNFGEMEICKLCNYWHWQPMLTRYTSE